MGVVLQLPGAGVHAAVIDLAGVRVAIRGGELDDRDVVERAVLVDLDEVVGRASAADAARDLMLRVADEGDDLEPTSIRVARVNARSICTAPVIEATCSASASCIQPVVSVLFPNGDVPGVSGENSAILSPIMVGFGSHASPTPSPSAMSPASAGHGSSTSGMPSPSSS